MQIYKKTRLGSKDIILIWQSCEVVNHPKKGD